MHKFNKFISINENSESKLKGYSSDQVIERIENLMEIMPDRVKFGIPADSKGYSTSYRDANGAIEKIKDVHVLGVRSKTQVTKKVIDAAEKLMVVSAFCIGTKQIDLEACKSNGVVVFNAPYSNTRSVVELAIGQIIM